MSDLNSTLHDTVHKETSKTAHHHHTIRAHKSIDNSTSHQNDLLEYSSSSASRDTTRSVTMLRPTITI
jgi:hypothetical protein